MNDGTLPTAQLARSLEVALSASLRQGAERVAATARATAPVLRRASGKHVPGALRDAIGVQMGPAGTGTVTASVVIDGAAVHYGRFQELGFHAVGGKRVGGGLRAHPVRLQQRIDEGTAHFVPGLHFLKHAFDANKGAIAADAAARVRAVIDQANR